MYILHLHHAYIYFNIRQRTLFFTFFLLHLLQYCTVRDAHFKATYVKDWHLGKATFIKMNNKKKSKKTDFWNEAACIKFGIPTKRQVSKRLVSKRLVSKPQVYKTSGLQNVRFQNVWFQKVQFLNLIYLLNKKYLYLSFLLITSHYGDIWQKSPLK